MWLGLGILLLLALVGLSFVKGNYIKKQERMRANGLKKVQNGEMSDPQLNSLVEAERFPLPAIVNKVILGIAIVAIGIGSFHHIFFYAEPGFVYHVRTILGQERVVDGTGYSLHLLGRINSWKKAMTVQAVNFTDVNKDGIPDTISAEEEGGYLTSATLPPLHTVMLDQVDAKVSATVRFRIPTDREAFLKMAHDYRTPANLLRTALVPAFKETLQATGSLMGAEEYYSGRRTEFNAEFENQMSEGIYLVTRHQVVEKDPTAAVAATAAADLGTDQTEFGSTDKIKWVVEKQKTDEGGYVRKTQNFVEYGIAVAEARVTNLKPNEKFEERMLLKQQAAADRAVAKEQRVQEVEQKLLVVAKGEREIAEKQAEAKKEQITKTTNAETTKRLALIEAGQKKEQALIDKQTAQIRKEQADIDALRIKVLAEADKYEREAKIAGDNALDKKLDAEVAIQTVWAEAFAKRNVPQYVFGAGSAGEGGTPTGANNETATFMQLLTVDAAKRLAYDRGIPAVNAPTLQSRPAAAAETLQ